MIRHKRVALLMLGVASDKCGGAERFFADLFRLYRVGGEHELFFFIDPSTKNVLESIGRLRDLKNVVVLKNYNNRFKRFLEARDFRLKLKEHHIDVVHVTNYGTYYFDRLNSLRRKMPRVRLIVNIVDCEIPYILTENSHPRYKGYAARYLPLFNIIRPDAYYSWYELFGTSMKQNGLIPSATPVESVTTRFSDNEGFRPGSQKRQQFIFAARLTAQKQPLMFVDAVRNLKNEGVLEGRNWEFLMFGNGPQEEAIAKHIQESGLEGIVKLRPMTDLRPVFASSMCFVSTQDFENFPSLSMNEAMAAGNVIVARNVGQTELFVKDGVNGYLTSDHTGSGVAAAMRKVIENPDRIQTMMKESVRMTAEVHTPGNFIKQIDLFWSNLQ
ncbi:MAG: glycosyltransferase family 4 protein [Bacteroidia bacterium]|nr:glycosyltransferase family 4 protein [Bacteroidia bacterium]